MHVDATWIFNTKHIGYSILNQIKPLRRTINLEAIFGRSAYGNLIFHVEMKLGTWKIYKCKQIGVDNVLKY